MLTDVQLGNIAVRLALDFPRWIERRVLGVDFLDARTTRWTTGVMFRWPARNSFAAGAQPNEGETVYVPLDLLAKEALVSLEGTQPDGSPLPILPYSRSTQVASIGVTSIVLSEAKRHGVVGADADLHALVTAVVAAPRACSTDLLDTALHNSGGPLAQLLPPEHPVRGLLTELADDVMLLAPARYEPGEELVYRYTYCRDGVIRRPLSERVLDRLLFKDVYARTEHLPFGWGRSYHFQVRPPEEVQIPRARLVGSYQGESSLRVTDVVAQAEGPETVDLHARRPTQDKLEPSVAVVSAPHPHLSTGEVRRLETAIAAQPERSVRDDTGIAEVWFRLRPSGTFLVVTAIAVLTAVLLGLSL